MTRLFPVPAPGQRAAEEFDSVLGGRATEDVAERYAELVATVQVLSDQPLVTPRAEFAAELRSRLMLAAEADLVPAPPVVRRAPTRSQRNRRLGTAAAALVIVGGTAGMAAAASGALPGQSLYPIKRGIEQVTTAAHIGDAAKGSALLGQASQRLDEVDGLMSAGSPDADLVSSTLDSFNDQANAGADKLFKAYQTDADSADIATVRDFTASEMSQLEAMASTADPSTLGSLRDAADTVAEIDQQATTLCASCGGSGTLTPPPVLASGAGAATVKNLIARPVTQASADIALATAAQQAAAQQKIDGLKEAAEGAASKLAQGGSTSSSGSSAATDPVTSTLDAAGKLVPSVTTSTGTAVKNLVGGLTTTVTGGGGGSSGAAGGVVSGAGTAVGNTVDGVTGAVNGTVDGLTGTLQPKK